MPVYVKEAQTALYVHVPKTGGSTIERCLRNAEWHEAYHVTPVNTPPRLRGLHRISPQHWDAESLRSIFLLRRFDLIFMTVRHPLDRLLSEYGMREPDALPRNVDDFVRWMEGAFEDYAKNPFIFDNHIRPQVEFVIPEARIYRFEDGITVAIRKVAEVLDDPAIAQQEVHHARRGGRDFSAMREDPRVLDGVRAFYRKDLEELGYTL